MSDMNREVRSMQLWPEGKTVFVSGDPRGELFIHTGHDDKAGRLATDDERRAVLVETIAGELIERDLLVNDSALVSELMKLRYGRRNGDELGDAFSDENVSNLRPDPSDWTLAECREWLEDNGATYRPDPNPWAMDRVKLVELLDEAGSETSDEDSTETLILRAVDEIDSEAVDGLDEWRDAVRDNATECEIFQWFRVTPYLANRLEEIGQPVLDNDYGEWWGRTCCGQSIIMDGTFQRVAQFIAT